MVALTQAVEQFGPRCHENGIRGYGNTAAKVMLVGIAPAAAEMRIGKPMVGPSGNLTNNILLACGWSREQTYATNIVCHECNASPSFEQIMECRPRLHREVELLRPDLVVLLGSIVGELFFPGRKFGNVRGVIDYYAPWGVHVLPTYHPAACLHSNNEYTSRGIVRDFSKIVDFFKAPPRPAVDFEVVQDAAVAQAILDRLAARHAHGLDQFVTLDVETPTDKEQDTTVPVEQRVVCFSITRRGYDGSEQTWWFPGSLLRQINFPANLNWTYHHGMFDTVSLAEDIGVLLPIKHDTMYMSYALDERGSFHGLKSLGREYEAAGWWEEHPTAKKWADKLADTPWLQRYNSTDTAMTARIAERFYKRMQADDVLDVYNNILIPSANVYRLMQRKGIYVNPQRYLELLEEYVPRLEEKEQQLKDTIGSLGGDPNINIGSPDQLRKFLFGILRLPAGKLTDAGKASTDAEVLNLLAEEHPFILDLLDFRHLEKAVKTYLVGAYDDLRKDGRIHPHPNLHAQVTGRVGYSPYAVNTLPRETNDNPYLSKIRWLFTAPDDDTVLILVDYSQAEIWTAWAYCQDPNMLSDLQSGDFHTRSACSVFQMTPADITPERRSSSKKVTFGQFFGIGNDKLARDMTNENKRLGISKFYTREEAADMQSNWRARYPRYTDYITATIKEARTTGELVTFTKRKRRFPIIIDTSIVNQAINYKIQATAHDNVMLSLVDMWDTIIDLGAYPIMDGHDALAFEAKKSNAREVARCAVDFMEKVRIPGMPRVPAEAKFGFSLGEVQKVKL